MSQSWSRVTFSKHNPNQNFWTQPNTTHSLHPTQPNPTHHRYLLWHIRLYRKLVDSTFYKQLSMKVIIQLQYSLTDSRVFHDVKNITQSILHPTQPNPTHQKLKNSDPTQHNPWMDPTHDQLCGVIHKQDKRGRSLGHIVYVNW